MAVFRDPKAPAGRVVFGGEVFIDGLTADIEIGEGTRQLFESAGITEAEVQRSPKEELQAEAQALGLDHEGTKAEIQARIDEYRTAGTGETEE